MTYVTVICEYAFQKAYKLFFFDQAKEKVTIIVSFVTVCSDTKDWIIPLFWLTPRYLNQFIAQDLG